MRRQNQTSVISGKSKTLPARILKDRKGFSVIEFLLFLIFMGVIAFIVVPNINFFLGVDKKLSAANIEAVNIRAAAQAYETNTGKYPANSNLLWSNPAGPADYTGKPRAYYTFDIGNGRIISAAIGNEENAPTDSWTGIMWDFDSGSWVKQ